MTGYVVRRANLDDEAVGWTIVDEYNRMLQIIARDEPGVFRTYLLGPGALWLAEQHGVVIGCVAFRPLPELGLGAGEVKRLYVRADHRGSGIAGALLCALESWARKAGYPVLYLDCKDDLQAALRFYEKSGYERVPRYNDNPQATIFMRRRLEDGSTGSDH